MRHIYLTLYLAVLSVLVDCLEQSNVCVFVSQYMCVCVGVCDRRQLRQSFNVSVKHPVLFSHIHKH